MKEFMFIMKYCSQKTRLKLLGAVIFCGAISILSVPVGTYLCIDKLQITCWRIQFYYDRQTSLLAAATNINFLIDAVTGLILALCVTSIIAGTKCGLRELYGACAKSLKTDAALEVNHGKTVLAVARRIRRAPVEYGATFLPDAKKLGEYTNYDAECVGRSEEWTRVMRYTSECTDVHNHPNATSVPSSQDLQFYSYNCVGRGIIVASKEVTVIDIPSGFWQNEQAQELIEQQYAAVLQQTESLSPEKMRAIYSSLISQLASQYGVKSTTLPFWRWYMSEFILDVRRGYYHRRETLSALLTNVTSYQKVQH